MRVPDFCSERLVEPSSFVESANCCLQILHNRKQYLDAEQMLKLCVWFRNNPERFPMVTMTRISLGFGTSHAYLHEPTHVYTTRTETYPHPHPHPGARRRRRPTPRPSTPHTPHPQHPHPHANADADRDPDPHPHKQAGTQRQLLL